MSSIEEGTSASSAQGRLYQPYDQFLLFGDSITEFSCNQSMGFAFHPALQDSYIRRLDVINRGFSGYTSANALQVLPSFFPTPRTSKVRLMTIFFGANDACLPGKFQHVPLGEYKKNLEKLIEHPAVKEQNPRVIIITPPPVNEHQFFDMDDPSRRASNTKLYAEAAREVAGSLGVPVADIWTRFMEAAGWQEGQPLLGSRDVPKSEKLQSFLTDGLHLTPDGYRIVYEEVMKVIRANWPDQTPEQLSRVFPGWQDAPK